MKIRWDENTRQYATGEIGSVGRWKLFSTSWNSCMSRDDPDKESKKISLGVKLPGLKNTFLFSSHEEAKQKANELLEYWIEGLNKENN